MGYNSLMRVPAPILNCAVAAWLALGGAALAETVGPELDRLFATLQGASAAEAVRIESDIWRIWSRSGSAAMDLLLERGRKAAEQGDFEAALDHLTALTDHAPDFAEGWNARATVFFQTGAYGPAIADLQRVLALNPRHFGALSGFGMILEEIDRPAQALEAYRAALTLHPHMQGVIEAVSRLEAKTSGSSL
jgi:tetratricopeptide (TPR) repeat protein